MSTRCQIEFREEVMNGAQLTRLERRTIYQHSDGYPDGEQGVISTLRRFFAWEQKERGFDIEYTPANYIYWSKCQDVALLVQRADSPHATAMAESTARLGYGVCENDEFHQDIEFFYEVALVRQPSAGRLLVRPYQVVLPFGQAVERERMKRMKPVAL